MSYIDATLVDLYQHLKASSFDVVTDNITSFEKHLESSSDHTLSFYLNLVKYRFKNMFLKVFNGDLVYKLRRVKSEANLVSSGLKIVKRLRRRKYDPVVFERTMGLVVGPSTALYRSFLKHCTCPNLLRGDKALISSSPLISRDSFEQSFDLSSLPDGWNIPYSCGLLYVLLIYCFYLLRCLCNNFYGLSAFVGC